METLTENGIVSEIIRNKIKIQIPIKPECEECRSIFCSKSEQNYNVFEIETTEKFELGDKVHIQLLGKDLTKATMVLFVIPLFIIIISITILIKVIDSAITSAILGFLVMLIYFVIFRFKKIWVTAPKIVKYE